MAVAVDSFELLWDQLSVIFKESLYFNKRSPRLKDILVIIGGIYVANKAFILTRGIYRTIKEYGVARVVRADPIKLFGRWAVVTGSTHGIGKAYAQELASKGCNIVIISLGKADCEAVANDIESQFGVDTCIIPVDFDNGKPVYNGIRETLADKDIGILVNNVGVMYDYPQVFLDVPEEKLWQLIHVNVAAATMLTKIVLPGMVKRGRGAVLTVCSGSTLMPTPQMTVYSATNAYLDVFMRALSYEYRNSGVVFQVLLPFYVATRMTQFSSTLSNQSLFIPSATSYVRSALTTLGWTTRSAGYWPHMLQALSMSFISEAVWMWGSMRLNDAFRRQAFTHLHRRKSSRLKANRSPPDLAHSADV